jgi:hypothetical protein
MSGCMIRLHARPHLPSRQQVASFPQSSCAGEGGRGEHGTESYDLKKAWLFITRSIPSALTLPPLPPTLQLPSANIHTAPNIDNLRLFSRGPYHWLLH